MKLTTVIVQTIQQRLEIALSRKAELELELETLKSDIKAELIANGGEPVIVGDKKVSLDAMPGRTTFDKDKLKHSLVEQGIDTVVIMSALGAASKTGEGYSQLSIRNASKADLAKERN